MPLRFNEEVSASLDCSCISPYRELHRSPSSTTWPGRRTKNIRLQNLFSSSV